ncbi:hypothetical protein [Nonomuraea jabiensis]|uniref:hypothetical protein n=1 Tax=Nonomuraea jabiensis TaxID=882448 RepID=UPI003D71534C
MSSLNPEVREAVEQYAKRSPSTGLAAGTLFADDLLAKHPELDSETLASVLGEVLVALAKLPDNNAGALLLATTVYDLANRTHEA